MKLRWNTLSGLLLDHEMFVQCTLLLILLLIVTTWWQFLKWSNHPVQVEYDPRMTSFRELLDVFWSSHDSRQVFGQGPDVGNQYRYLFSLPSLLLYNHTPEREVLWFVESYQLSRSIIFTNGTEESRIAALSKEKEQTRSKNSVITTHIQQLGVFYPAEPEHQVCYFLHNLKLVSFGYAVKWTRKGSKFLWL